VSAAKALLLLLDGAASSQEDAPSAAALGLLLAKGDDKAGAESLRSSGWSSSPLQHAADAGSLTLLISQIRTASFRSQMDKRDTPEKNARTWALAKLCPSGRRC
jgi:hypothetical protein